MGVNCCDVCRVFEECQLILAKEKEGDPNDPRCACQYEDAHQYHEAMADFDKERKTE